MTTDSATTDVFAGQPIVELERDGVRYTLLGTAHVSKTSIDAVMAAIDTGRFDAVAVELDEQRRWRPTSAGWPNNSASNPAQSSRPRRWKPWRAGCRCN